jgi:hypothetical protein
MKGNHYLNGCDYLMLGFDHESRRHGFAGNSCQIVLELGTVIPAAALEQRLGKIAAQYPILNARPTGLFSPRWNLPVQGQPPRVRVHEAEAALCQQALNEPLAVHRGELARFDLLQRAGGKMDLVFTWAHALMDAPSAEHFLAIAGNEELSMPGDSLAAPAPARLPLLRRCKLAWKSLYQLDRFCQAAPRSLGKRQTNVPAQLQFQVQKFSAEETKRVRANGVSQCGILGDAQYHAAVSVVELHQLHQRLHSPSPSYVLPVPVGLRPKGSVEPLFSNQVGMLMLQFLPEHLDSVAHAVATLKTQTEQAMRAGLLDSGRLLSEMFRFLPLPIYMAVLKQGLRGEICSLFYGDTAAVNPLLTTFLGANIEDFAHVAAVPPSPGLGVVYYYFRGELRVTVLHATTVLAESEAAEFAARLRCRLLDP